MLITPDIINKIARVNPAKAAPSLRKLCTATQATSRERGTHHLTMEFTATTKESHGHATHATPPQAVCNVYKKYQRLDDAAVEQDFEVVDFNRGLTAAQKEKIMAVDEVSPQLIFTAQNNFRRSQRIGEADLEGEEILPDACTVYEHKDFEGLRIFPALLPPECQFLMLDALLHRDLSNPFHKTNIHPDYTMPYPPPEKSFFAYPICSKYEVFKPKNPHSKFKQLDMTQFLRKKLRYLTIGDQYDWTTRSYTKPTPTPFPSDISNLITTLFRNSFIPESGVVLLYSPKDFMPVHRDVSELCQRGLASFTIGCDGLFVLSKEKTIEGKVVDEEDEEREMQCLVLRVRSGDCIWMGGETRWCWHAMPKVMANTCPEELQSWPVRDGYDKQPENYDKWKGYMKNMRLNISCRQVWG